MAKIYDLFTGQMLADLPTLPPLVTLPRTDDDDLNDEYYEHLPKQSPIEPYTGLYQTRSTRWSDEVQFRPMKWNDWKYVMEPIFRKRYLQFVDNLQNDPCKFWLKIVFRETIQPIPFDSWVMLEMKRELVEFNFNPQSA